MNQSDILKLRPLRNLVAFVWVKPHWLSELIIPDTVYDLKALPGQTEGIRTGNFYVGKIIDVGPKVDEIKRDDLIVLHEFGIKNYEGSWKENVIYFIEAESIMCKLIPDKNERINIERIKPGKREIERMMKKIEEETTKEDSKDYVSQVRERRA